MIRVLAPGGCGFKVRGDRATQLECPIGDRLPEASLVDPRAVEVTHILQRHRRARQISYRHLNRQTRPIGLKTDGGGRKVVMAEAFDIFTLPFQRQRLIVQHQPGAIHTGAGHFTVQRMVVLWRRAAVSQQPRMECKTAIGVDDRMCGQRLFKTVAHGQVMIVELHVPDHLSEKRQHGHAAAPVVNPHRLNARRIAKQLNPEVIALQQHPRRGVKLVTC